MVEATFRVLGLRHSPLRGLLPTLFLLLPAAGACSSSAPVAAERVEAEEARLLQPFEADRTVVADQVTIELSANFDDDVVRPAAASRSVAEDGDVVFRWSNPGALQTSLRFRIGNTLFVALHGATLRIRGSGKNIALAVQAAGQVSEAVGDADRVDCSEVRIEDGRYVRR